MEFVAPDSEELVTPPEEELLAPDSEELVAPELVAPESEELLTPDSLPTTAVPDSLPPGAFICGRCHLLHEDREAWNRAHSLLWPCARCGLVHLDYWMSSTIRSIDEFDCAAAGREAREGGRWSGVEEDEQQVEERRNSKMKIVRLHCS